MIDGTSMLREIQLGDIRVMGMTSGRIYGKRWAQGTDFPCTTVNKVSGRRLQHLAGKPSMVLPVYQVDCWARTHLAAMELADAVEDVLDRFTGTVRGVRVQLIMIADDPIEQFEEVTQIYQVPLEAMMALTVPN